MNTEQNHLLDLIEAKNFKDLTSTERRWVLSEMSEESYRQQRSMHLELSVHFESITTPTPPPFTLIEKKSKVKAIVPWWQKELPFYKSAIVAASIAILTFFWGRQKPAEIKWVEKEVVEVQTITDTVLVEKVTEKISPQIVTKVVYQNKTIEVKNPKAVEERTLPSVSQMPSMSDIQTSFGNSRVDNKELEQFKFSL